jgi:hypothetical protein
MWRSGEFFLSRFEMLVAGTDLLYIPLLAY